jgi:hypothetical protein
MDAKQFDELVARLTSGPSRRDALKGLVGGALAAAGLTAETLAKGKGRGKGHGAGGEHKRGKGKKGSGAGARGKGKSKNRGGKNPMERCNCHRCSTECASGEFTRKRVGKKGHKRTICKCKPYGS